MALVKFEVGFKARFLNSEIFKHGDRCGYLILVKLRGREVHKVSWVSKDTKEVNVAFE